ncbi:MAG: RidA family protein [Caulobacteraceae bacterium]
MPSPDERLRELGIDLPEPAKPVANYVPFVRTGDLVHISGQVSIDLARSGEGVRGVVGESVDLDQARSAARLCGINLIAQMKAACGGDLARVKRVVRLGGFVQAGPRFFDIPTVIDGCSELMVEVFGEAGRHARSSVGVYRLPLDFAVEVDATIEAP